MKFSEVNENTFFVIIASNDRTPLFYKNEKGEACRITIDQKTKAIGSVDLKDAISPDKEVQVITIRKAKEKTA